MQDWKEFYSREEALLSTRFLKKGFIVKEVESRDALEEISSYIEKKTADHLGLKDIPELDFLDNIHTKVSSNELNDLRLKLIADIHSCEWFRAAYFNLAKDMLSDIVGNELVMQTRLNLSIQLPGDDSSLLPIHSDVWSGDSPYEVVIWLPLVDCFNTKSMYLLNPEKLSKHSADFLPEKHLDSEALYQLVKDDLIWLDVQYGQVLLFNQNLPHGNRVNIENQTRWSINCRFKSIFSPYEDKKIGEFFEPITLKPLTKFALTNRWW